ncbi:alpha/beta fold hydrolase [Reinekea marinisedimentorum]|uniref:Alpha/beta hydrolase family protein n=1 Tax=Reinekea marinisedimentorum TaxID=230495 RepID=A0A4R3I3Q3_9GAMM|nr:alpha/beta fold hydrolase [Reinekea marinisedimentorum]TCS40464.1 alpha/beta hydrolase family protein [Reinekea marinisedimentorum]
MATPLKSRWQRHFKKTDAIAVAQLVTMTGTDVIDVTEQVHLSVLQQLSLGGWFTSGTRLVYQGVKVLPFTTQILLNAIARNVAQLKTSQKNIDTSQRLNVIAALNGVLGDQLASSHSPLNTSMEIIRAGAQNHPNKILFVHGLCMDDRAWSEPQTQFLADCLNADVWYLKYNTGLSIEDSARQLAQLLERELQPGQSVSLIGHSMGGLVSLHALIKAHAGNNNWYHNTRALVALGTPFAGTPMSSLGHWVEQQLSAFAVTRPFTKLTKRRSEGIKNLREGFIGELPSSFSVPSFCIAGNLETKSHKAIDDVIGDGLVTLESALALKNCKQQWTAPKTGHLKLLKDPQVFETVNQWLKPLY